MSPTPNPEDIARKYGGGAAKPSSSQPNVEEVAAKYGAFNASVSKLEGGAPYRFVSRLAENLNPVSAVMPLTTPKETIAAIGRHTTEKTRESMEAAKYGNYGRSALSAIEAIPFVGQLVSGVEGDIKSGNYAGAVGTGASIAAPELVKRIPGLNVKVPSSLNSVERSAVNWGRGSGVPVDLGTATGNRFVGALQGVARKQPFLAGRAAELTEQEFAKLQQAGTQLIQSTGRVGDKVAAGEGLIKAGEGRVNALHQEANQAFEELRRIAATKTKQVQIGSRPSTVVQPNGQPIMVPEFKTLEMPVATTNLKRIVGPIVDRLESTLPEAQRQSSPGFSVLRQIMARPDYVDINTAIGDLSAIQNLARTRGELDAVRGASKGLAATAIPPFRAAIDQAAADAGPDAVRALAKGRKATADKYAAAAILDQIPEEPAQVVARLTRPGDQGVQLLRGVRKVAPSELPNIGRSFLEGILDNMTSEGDVRRTGTALNAWNKLGVETKNILYPDPKVQASIGDFFKLAKMMTERANPSETATTFAAVLTALNPKIIAAQLFAGKPLADLLFGPGGGQVAQSGLPLRVVPKGAVAAGRATVGSNIVFNPPPPPPGQ